MNNKMLSIITLLAVLIGLPTLTMSSETSNIERYVETHRFVSNGNAHYDKFTDQYLLFLPQSFNNKEEASQACKNSSVKVNEITPNWSLSPFYLGKEVCKNLSYYRDLSGLKSNGNLLALGPPMFPEFSPTVLFSKNCKIGGAFNEKNGKLKIKMDYQKPINIPGNGELSTLCVANAFKPRYEHRFSEELKEKANKTKAVLMEKRHKKEFELSKQVNTKEAYQKFISIADKDSIYIEKANQQILQLEATSDFNKLSNGSSLYSYISFIKRNPKSIERDNAEQQVLKIIKAEKNISGLEWFISTYSNSKVVTEAISEIHKLAYAQAKKINTLSAYNTYIIAYPYSDFTEQALSRSRHLEEDKYDAIDKDEERKARLLAVKIKKMTINVNKAKSKAGYELVINRMSELLTNKYEATDASLRYYESKEFTNFASRFDQTMLDIKHVLSNIEDNTDGLMAAVKEGFASADADRDMAAYKLQQHEEWEKNMHLRDKGYN